MPNINNIFEPTYDILVFYFISFPTESSHVPKYLKKSSIEDWQTIYLMDAACASLF